MLIPINTSSFKPSFEMKLYITNLDVEFCRNRLKGKSKVVYISGPATGIDDYSERFLEVVSFLNLKEDFKDFYIINPMEELDAVSEYDFDGTYNDKIFLSMYLLGLSDIVILDDRSDKWKDSKGVLIELTNAENSNKSIISFKSLIDYYNGLGNQELHNFFRRY